MRNNGKYLNSLNIKKLQEMFDSYSKITGFSIKFLSYPDLKLVFKTNLTSVCEQFHLINNESKDICQDFQKELIMEYSEIKILTCKYRLITGIVPIIINEEKIGSLSCGQVFFENPDMDYYANIALKYNYNLQEYLELIKKVPVINRDDFIKGLKFLNQLVLTLTDEGINRINEIYYEKTINQTEKRFKEIFEFSVNGILLGDNNGVITNANKSFCELIGYLKKELVGKHIRELPFKKEDLLLNPFRFDLLKLNETVCRERILIHKNGTEIFVEMRSKMLPDGSYQSMFTDITSKKQAEKELLFSHETYKGILNNISESVYIQDENGVFIDVNETALGFYGIKKDEIIGKTPDLFSAEGKNDMKLLYDSHQKAYHGEPQSFEYWGKKKNGEIFLKEITLSPGYYFGKKVVIAVARDISERVKSQKALEYESNLRKLLIDISSVYINIFLEIVDEEINRSLEIISKFVKADRTYIFDLNTKTKICDNTYEWCAEGIIPQINDLKNIPLADEWIEKFVKGEKVYIPDILKLPEGYQKEILEPQGIKSLLAIPMIHNDLCIGFLGFDFVTYYHVYSETEQQILYVYAQMIVNVLVRKKNEEEKNKLQAQLVQAQKMESVGRLAGGVAHDFNNMLSVIAGNTELALTLVNSTSLMYHYLKEVQVATNKSANLTGQLLAFARKQTISPKEIHLNDTIENLLSMIGRLIGEDINLIWLPGERLWLIKSDPSQIDQIFANLCINARDAINGNGKIIIKTENIVIKENDLDKYPGIKAGDFVMISVFDNGSGMNEETISHIFEPFYTTKDINKGTGLGLATIYGIIKQNNGYIYVDSELCKGSEFIILLPRYINDKKDIEEKLKEKMITHGKETILIVEDEPSLLKISMRMLNKLGYNVIPAKSPAEAIKQLQESLVPVDLLITDVIMPEMNGKDLVDHIKKIYPDIKYVFMSGYTSDIISNHGVIDEGINFLQKPFSLQDLSDIIRVTLESQSD